MGGYPTRRRTTCGSPFNARTRCCRTPRNCSTRWTRRVDLNIAEPLANGYRFGEALKFFENRILCAPEASPGLKMIAANRLQWLNGQMADGREYLCGRRFTLADILLYCWLEFGNQVGQPLDAANTHIVAWMARVAQRQSVKA